VSKDTEPGCQDWKVEHGVLRPQPLVLHTVCCNGRLQDRLKRATACLERKQYRLYDHESSIRSGLVKQLSDPQTVEVLGPPCHGLVNSIRRAQLAALCHRDAWNRQPLDQSQRERQYSPPVFSLRRTVCGSHFTEHRRRIKQDEMPKEAWKVEHDRSREMMASRPMPESGYR